MAGMNLQPSQVTLPLSQIVLQVFEHSSHSAHFCSILEPTTLLQVLIPTCPAPTNKFSHPSEYLTIESKLKINNSRFKLSPINMVLFNDLKKGKEQLKKAMKAFRKKETAEDDA